MNKNMILASPARMLGMILIMLWVPCMQNGRRSEQRQRMCRSSGRMQACTRMRGRTSAMQSMSAAAIVQACMRARRDKCGAKCGSGRVVQASPARAAMHEAVALACRRGCAHPRAQTAAAVTAPRQTGSCRPRRRVHQSLRLLRAHPRCRCRPTRAPAARHAAAPPAAARRATVGTRLRAAGSPAARRWRPGPRAAAVGAAPGPSAAQGGYVRQRVRQPISL